MRSPTCSRSATFVPSPRGRRTAGPRARVKLAEVDAKLVELTAVRDTLRAALDAGCDDLIVCAESPCCPLPFTATIPVGAPNA